MSIVNTTQGIRGVNGDLNISGKITAQAIAYYDTNGNSVDITNALQNVSSSETAITAIIFGSQPVGNASNSANITLGDASSSNAVEYLTFASSGTGNNSLNTCTKITVQPSSGFIHCQNLETTNVVVADMGLSIGSAYNNIQLGAVLGDFCICLYYTKQGL